MIRVLALTRYDRLGASSRLRMLDFIAPLATRGIAVTAAPLMDDGYLTALYAGRRTGLGGIGGAYLRRLAALFSPGRHDVIWLEKEALPFLPDWIEGPLLSGRPYVMDIDDAWYLRYADHPNPMVRALLGRKFERLARGARLVAAGNRHLADWATAAGARAVALLPTVVDLDRYPPTPPRQTGGPLIVGWIGSPSTAGYLDLIAEPLRRLGDRVTLRAIGLPDLVLPGLTVEGRPWREADEAADLAACDVGVMPLKDSAWERGKCGYKLIQYLAAGRPVVASPVGVNAEIVRPGENGFLAADADQWAQALGALADDADLRRRYGAAGRALVAQRYAQTAVLPQLAEILTQAAA